MDFIILSSINYSGYVANITFYPLTGGTISLGYHTIPYSYLSNFVYGSYDLYFSSASVTCTSIYYPDLLYMTANTSYNSSFQITAYGTAANINWGDGSPTQSITNTTITHNYSGTGIYQISFAPVNITQLSLGSGNLIKIGELPDTLTSLDVGGNHLSSLYVSNLTRLTSLVCSNNNIISLNLQYNNSLTNLNCSHNLISSFTQPSSSTLLTVDIGFNNLSSLFLSNQTAITGLNCSDNSLTGITLPIITNYYFINLDFSNNNINSFNFDYIPNLEFLNCSGNTLTGLTLTTIYLSYISCQNNNITNLNLSSQSQINYIDCSFNLLTGLTLNVNAYINYLNCGNNSLTTINNLIYFDGLQIFNCNNNLFTTNTINSFLSGLLTAYNNNGFSRMENQLPSPPSGQGIIDLDYMINVRGWTITYDLPITTIVFNATVNPNVSFNIVGNIYNINWGDGTTASTYSTGVVSHTYSSGGLKTVTFGTQLTLTELHQTNYNNLVSVSDLPSTLTSLTFRSQYLVSLNLNIELSGLMSLDCDSCGLNSTSLDDVLLLVDTFAQNNSLIGGTLILTNQIPLASPSPTGLDYKNDLIDFYSWDVQTD
jgi:hypothetical protein